MRDKILYLSNYLIILYAFFLPLNKDIVSIIGKILIVIFFFKKDLKKYLENIYNIKFFKIFLLLVLFSLFISFYSLTISYGLHYTLKKYLPYLEIFVIAGLLDKKFINYVLSAFLSGMFVSEIISYGIHFGLWETKYNLNHFGINDPTPFMHHTLYSLFLSIGILTILITIFKEKKLNFLLIFFLITMSINLFITGGRGGQLAFFISLIAIVVISKHKKYLLLIPIGVIFFLLAYNFSPIFHDRVNKAIHDVTMLINNFNFCSSWGIRASAWILSFEMLKNGHWLFGFGYHNYIEVMKHLIDTQYSNLMCAFKHLKIHLHNQYLTMIIDGGVIYLYLFLLWLYEFIKLPIKNTYFNKIKFIVFINFMFLSFVEPVFFQSWSMYLFIFFAGLLLAEYNYEKKEFNSSNGYETSNTGRDSV